MKKRLLVVLLLGAVTNLSLADQLCGVLWGVCGNGWCKRLIRPKSVEVVADNEAVAEQIRALLKGFGTGQGPMVCAQGQVDTTGIFRATNVVATSESLVGQLCGKLWGVCGNGWCKKFITSHSVELSADNQNVAEKIEQILKGIGTGHGPMVCAEGQSDLSGNFRVISVTKTE